MTSAPTTSIPLTSPTTEATRRYDFDHIPKLGPYKPGDKRGSLLPKEGGRPGLTYAQIPLKYARQAESVGWLSMFDSCRYTIIGPKGSIDMELMAQGKIIPSLAAGSTKCICKQPILVKADGTRVNLICEATGLDENTGFASFELKLPPPNPIDNTSPNENTTNAESTNKDIQQETVEENTQSKAGQPEPDEQTGSRKGSRYTKKP